MKSKAVLVALALAASGCASSIEQKMVTLSNGQVVDYVYGKIAGDGQEGVFVDRWTNGQLASDFGAGQSLTGQVLQGAVGAALIGGGMVGAAAALRPDETRLTNEQAQSQSQSVSQRVCVKTKWGCKYKY